MSSLILIGSISYTIYKLKRLFPNRDNPEVKRIIGIGSAFIFAFVFKTIYEWAIYLV